MAGCNDLPRVDCSLPSKGGNTYEITIKASDRLIVTVEDDGLKSKPKTTISPLGISIAQTENGQMYHEVHWSIRPDKP